MLTEEISEAAATIDAWERQEGESSKAFAAFRHYRDLHESRSVLKAYRLGTSKAYATAPAGHWVDWSSKFDWPRRAQAYDAFRERERRKQDEEAFDAALISYRDKIRQLAAATLANAVNLLVKLNARIQSLEINDITPALIPGLARAAAYTASVASEQLAQGLAVGELISQLAEVQNTSSITE